MFCTKIPPEHPCYNDCQIMAAVRQNWRALKYAGEEANNNPEVVMAAIRQNGMTLKEAGEEAKNNPEVVMAAVLQDGYALQFAGEEAKNFCSMHIPFLATPL